MGELKADLFMKTYNLMGYDAFTPGELDLSFGVENLMQMSQQANFPFLAANLLHSKTKKPVFKPYLIKEVQGGKVGLLGLISKRHPLGMGGPPEEKEKFHLADPIETAKKIVPLLKKKCKLIAVLGHMEEDEQQMLAKACPDIFFILSGHVPRQQPNPIRASNSQIFIAGSRGEHLGQVDFLIEGRHLYARYQLIDLTANYADHPQVQQWLNQYKTDLQNLTQTLSPAGPQNELGDEPKQ
jgi:2',3'-cyclic-nucleotide 2'-phosphodiesterase (5'-nucleotidase family)